MTVDRYDDVPAGGYLFWANPNAETAVLLDNVRITPHLTRSLGRTVWPSIDNTTNPVIISPDGNTATWPASANIDGIINKGFRGQNDFVTVGTVGLSYTTASADGGPMPNGQLAPPTGMTVSSAASRRTSIRCDNYPGAASYRIYEGVSADLAEEVATPYRVSDPLVLGRTYHFFICAVVGGVETLRASVGLILVDGTVQTISA